MNNSNNHSILQDILTEHSAKTGETQVDVAARMKITKSALNHMIHRKGRVPEIPTLVKIRRAIRWPRKKFWNRVMEKYD